MEQQIDTVTVVVRRLRVMDKNNRERLFALLQPVFGRDEFSTTELWNFVNLCCTTDSITGVDFQIPDPDAGFDIWEEAWHKYGALDNEVVQGWIALHNQVNTSPNDRKFLPPDQLNDDEKKSGQANEGPTAVV